MLIVYEFYRKTGINKFTENKRYLVILWYWTPDVGHFPIFYRRRLVGMPKRRISIDNVIWRYPSLSNKYIPNLDRQEEDV